MTEDGGLFIVSQGRYLPRRPLRSDRQCHAGNASLQGYADVQAVAGRVWSVATIEAAISLDLDSGITFASWWGSGVARQVFQARVFPNLLSIATVFSYVIFLMSCRDSSCKCWWISKWKPNSRLPDEAATTSLMSFSSWTWQYRSFGPVLLPLRHTIWTSSF